MMFHNDGSPQQAEKERRCISLCIKAGMTEKEARKAIHDWREDGAAIGFTAEAWADRIIRDWKRNQ